MSNDVVIKIENLCKEYRLGVISHGTLHRDLQSWWSRIRGKEDPNLRIDQTVLTKSEERKTMDAGGEDRFWALQDVSFDVKKGEIVGIIGKNGAGKSTLLKILSRVTAPTRGVVKIKGRVASLLEVGTGFHPELTGEENIFLNGAILGMTKDEIKRKFDEIVAFAEINKFIDTPVKRYSSGMYVRLAFAVAAHLEPEILIVDEALAVGDTQFQKKCLGKMKDVALGGRTVLFVSHNMPAVRTLCTRAILLDNGVIKKEGTISEVVDSYLNSGSLESNKIWDSENRPGNNSIKLNSVKLKNASGVDTSSINISENALVEIEYEVVEKGAKVGFSLILFDSEGCCVFGSLSNVEINYYGKPLNIGRYLSTSLIYGNLLNEGKYYFSIIGFGVHMSDMFNVDQVITLDAIDDGVLKGDYPGKFGGSIRPKLEWRTIKID